MPKNWNFPLSDLLICPQCGWVYLVPRQGQPAECNKFRCQGVPLRPASQEEKDRLPMGVTVGEPTLRD